MNEKKWTFMEQFSGRISVPEAHLLMDMFGRVLDRLEIPRGCGVFEQNSLGRSEIPAAYGTFIMDVQKFGNSAECALRFSLSGGMYRRPRSLIEQTSGTIAAESIDEILGLPGTSSYYGDRYPQLRNLKTVRDVPSGIYQKDELNVLVLNAEYGRILAGFCMSSMPLTTSRSQEDVEWDNRASTAFLYATAQIMRKMFVQTSRDVAMVKVLDESTTTVLNGFNAGDAESIRMNARALRLVDEYFGDQPDTPVWKEWRRNVKNFRNVTPLFLD